jgi:drug/metabolite transporter (DMT)-like permease
MNIRTLKSDGILLLAAAIWGFAFVAQRVGMLYIGPFTFNAVRFALGALVLLPFLYFQQKKSNKTVPVVFPKKVFWSFGLLAGVALFLGSSLQQIGIINTTAGNAGFITGLYVVIVPILGLLLKQKARTGTWIGAIIATIGLFLLSVTESFTISPGDLLVLISALFWASHVLIIGKVAGRVPSLFIAVFQFAVCSLLSFICAIIFEEIKIGPILQAGIPILYAGLLSVGIAYTLQIVAQKKAPPAHAAIILSMESVFAVLGGWLMLSEIMAFRGLIGCALMLVGMLVSQLANWSPGRKKDQTSTNPKKQTIG